MSAKGRTSRYDSNPANGRKRRVSPVAAHSNDRLLSEPTAGAHPFRREPLFMPPHLPFAIPVGTRSVGWFAARQLSGNEPAEADAYLLSSRPSTTCVARSVAVDSITR